VIALPYGPNTDWLKNVLVSGLATIATEPDTRFTHPPGVALLPATFDSSHSPFEQ